MSEHETEAAYQMARDIACQNAGLGDQLLGRLEHAITALDGLALFTVAAEIDRLHSEIMQPELAEIATH